MTTERRGTDALQGARRARGACEPCLRRAWLLGRLAPLIERAAADLPGRRTPELLALSDAELIAAIAPSEQAAIGAELTRFRPASLRERLAARSAWSCCPHAGPYPAPLRGEPQAPAALLCRGGPARLGGLDEGAVVTIVGSRRPSAYGREVARSLAAGVAAAGLTVVSGMALGIDSCAHEGALEAGGSTIAVLGSGPDVASPASRRGLYERLVEEGVIVSELPPGTRGHRWTFPARNRIMAGLGRLTVVVEAGFDSGSLITARMASDLGRDVGAVPGQIVHPLAAGANALIADGALLVRGPEDVLDALLGAGAGAARASAPRAPALADELAPVLDAVERGAATPDAIASAAGLPVGAVAAGLAQLEALGYLRVDLGGRYERTALGLGWAQRRPDYA